MKLFRVSIRTLLFLTALIAAYLGWLSSIVQHRKSELQRLRAINGLQVIPMDNPGWTEPSTNPFRKWLGDVPIKKIWYYPNAEMSEEQKRSLHRIFPEADIAEYLPEPCHPGCFPSDTIVQTNTGPKPIEHICMGDVVEAIEPSNVTGERVWREVLSVFRTTNELWRVRTTKGDLVTTSTQPLLVIDQGVKQAGQIKPGMSMLYCGLGVPVPAEVVSIESTGRIEPVHNLILGDGVLFLANGFVAQSKPPSTLNVRTKIAAVPE